MTPAGKDSGPRTYAPELKLRLAKLVVAEGQSPSAVAEAHGIATVLIHRWSKLYRETGAVGRRGRPPRAQPQARTKRAPVAPRVARAPAPPQPEEEEEEVVADEYRDALALRDAEIRRLRRAFQALRRALDILLSGDEE